VRNRIAVLVALLISIGAGTAVIQGWAAAVPAVLGALVVGVVMLALERSRERKRSS
jgi:CHASE2 domain-containing sensor protein